MTESVPNAKRPRLDLPVRVEARSSTRIIDLNNDCLEHIFKMLKMNDLLNMADVKKSFKQPADAAFVRNFGKTEFIIEIGLGKNSEHPSRLSSKQIHIDEVSNSLKLLRNFGHIITSLRIGDSLLHRIMGFDRYHRVIPYVVQYCRRTLKAIYIQGAMNFELNWINAFFVKPYPEVTSVVFYLCKLNGNLADCTKWFPKLRNLTLKNIEFIGPRWNRSHPHLRCLKFESSIPKVLRGSNFPVLNYTFVQLDEIIVPSGVVVCNDEFIEFLRRHPTVTKFNLNLTWQHERQWGVPKIEIAKALPNLRVAQFGSYFHIDEALEFFSFCKMIERFSCSLSQRSDYDILKSRLSDDWLTTIDSRNYVQIFKATRVQCRNVRLLEMEMYRYGSTPLWNYSFEGLDEVVTPPGRMECTVEFIDFLRKHPTITKLNFDSEVLLWDVPVIEVAKALPNLKSIQFRFVVEIDDIMHFANLCKNIERLSFDVQYCRNYRDLKNRLGNNWHTIMNDLHVQVFKRHS